MKYHLDSMLPIRAFSPRSGRARGFAAGGMTLEGGGDSGMAQWQIDAAGGNPEPAPAPEPQGSVTVSAAPASPGPVSSDQLNQLYEQYLGRPVDASGASSWTGQCINQVIAGITGSQEYANRGGGAPGTLTPVGSSGGVCLNQLYHQYLGRCVDPSGAAAWAGKCINQVIAGITGSQEYANRGGVPVSQTSFTSGPQTGDAQQYVEALYQQVLNRPMDSGAQNWVQALQSGQMTPQEVANSIAASQEVQQNAALQANAQNYANALAANFTVCTSAITNPADKDPYLKKLNLDPEEAKRIIDLKSKDQNQYYNEVAQKLKDQAFEQYWTNSGTKEAYNQLQQLKDVNPAAYYANQLDFLSKQVGWQVGQNTADRAKPVEEQIKALIPEAQKAGLSAKRIEEIVNKGASSANIQNQQRIANLAEAGGTGFNFQKDILPGLTFVGAGTLAMMSMDPEIMAAVMAPAAAPAVGTAASTTPAWLTAAGQGALTGGTLGGINAAINGGNIGQGVLRGAATGAVGSGIGAGIGNTAFGNIASGAASGALGAKLAGANVGRGALVGGLGGAMNYGMNQIPGLQLKPGEFGLPNLARGAITGGVLNKVMGGCFAKGLESGAINSVLNYGMNRTIPSLNLAGQSTSTQTPGIYGKDYQQSLSDYYSQKLPYEAYKAEIQSGTSPTQAYNNYVAAMEANGFPINQATGQPWSVTGSGLTGDAGIQTSAVTPQVDTSTIGSPSMRKISCEAAPIVNQNVPGQTSNEDGSITITVHGADFGGTIPQVTLNPDGSVTLVNGTGEVQQIPPGDKATETFLAAQQNNVQQSAFRNDELASQVGEELNKEAYKTDSVVGGGLNYGADVQRPELATIDAPFGKGQFVGSDTQASNFDPLAPPDFPLSKLAPESPFKYSGMEDVSAKPGGVLPTQEPTTGPEGLPNPEAVDFVRNMTPEQSAQVTAQMQNVAEEARIAAGEESKILTAGAATATAPSILDAMANFAKSFETNMASRLATLAESNPAIRAILSSAETAAPYLRSLGISTEAIPGIVSRFGSIVSNPMVAIPIIGTDLAAQSITSDPSAWAKYADIVSPEVKLFDPGVKEPPIVEPTKPSPVAPPTERPAPTRPVPVAPPAAPPAPVPVEPTAPPVPGCTPARPVPRPTDVPGCVPARPIPGPTPKPTDIPGCVPAKPIPGPVPTETPVETPAKPGAVPVPQTEEETKVQPQIAPVIPDVGTQVQPQTQTETETKTATEQEQAQRQKEKQLVDTIIDTTTTTDLDRPVDITTKTTEPPITDIIEAPLLPPALTAPPAPEEPVVPTEPIVPVEPVLPNVPTPTAPTAPKAAGSAKPSATLKKLLTPGKCKPPCFAVPHPKAKTVHGRQVKLGLGNFNVPVQAYQQPIFNPTALQQIQAAATGGHMKKLSAGGSSCSASCSPGGLRGTTVQGDQVALPMSETYALPVNTYIAPIYNPTSLQQIQGAKCGGSVQHLASGGFPAPQGLMRGRQFTFQHPITGLSPLAGAPAPLAPLGRAEGGEVHQPQFYSEGGLNNTYVKGDGDGTSDSIPAMLANGEFVIPADVVSSLGNGSNDSGAKILDEFLQTIRSHKRKADAKQLPPDSKGALGYLLEAKKKVKK